MHRSVVLGGTFDGLHKGHESILTRAFQEGKRVTIGLTSDRYITKHKPKQGIATYDERKQMLSQWLKDKGVIERAIIVSIDDQFGPTVPGTHHAPQPEGDFDAILVSTLTRDTAHRVNELRRDAGWRDLAIIEIPMVKATDGAPISSSRVRNHEIDTAGFLVMPESLRPTLQKPFGRVIVGEKNIRDSVMKRRNGTLITVGDIATKTLIDLGITPRLAVIDYLVGRTPFRTHEVALKKLNLPTKTVVSGPGHISKAADDTIRSWSTHPEPMLLIVRGEEDLLTLPAIVHAPIGSFVYYGQPPMAAWARFAGAAARRVHGPTWEGLVEVEVTEEKKKEIVGLLAQFTNPTDPNQ